jgi:bifunctional non-homologous end joining protein LigD
MEGLITLPLRDIAMCYEPGVASEKTEIEIDDRRLVLSNLGKVLYPSSGFTKGEIIDYYVRIASVLLPHIRDRPLTLRRYPDGVEAPSFFAKHVPRGAPDWLRVVKVPASGDAPPRGGRTTSDEIDFVVVDELASLVWVANLAALELHVPLWHIGRSRTLPARPDHMVFDLDPGEGASIVECCAVAALLEDDLSRSGLEAYPKTSGSKGLQLYVPLQPKGKGPTWESVREDSYELALRLERDHPQLVVSNMRKDLRRGRVLIDWSQNHPAKTTVAVYSLRARPDPTVSTPVRFDEVARCAKASDASLLRFTAADVTKRVEQLGDLFAPVAASSS